MMGISCICPTFGRANLLEEAIESFLRQDYPGEKELVILNDAPWQKLKIDEIENVKLYNLSERCKNMGSKWNVLVGLAKHNTLIPWPNDDIMLPWSISRLVELLGDQGYVHPKGHFGATNKVLRGYSHHGCQGIIAFTRDAWQKTGGYPKQYGGQDTAFLKELRRHFKYNEPQLTKDNVFFIYRWAGIPLHLSGTKTDETWDKLAERIQANYPEPVYHLKPHWNMDYVEGIANV